MEIGRPPAFSEQYGRLLGALMAQEPERNVRTGRLVRAMPGGVSLRVDLSDNRVPTCGHRRLYPGMAAAELAWFLMGTRAIVPLQEMLCKFWDKFVEPDGTVANAYGWRWREHFGRDQIEEAIGALSEDPSNRQVVVSAWDPSTDGLRAKGAKNVPCPAMFTFSIVGGLLHSTLLIRSSDVFVGLPYDVMSHAMLMAVVAASVGYPSFPGARDVRRPGLGTLQVSLAHPHLYEDHWADVDECREGYLGPHDGPGLVFWPLRRVEGEFRDFVALYKEGSRAVTWPSVKCRPEVVA